MSCGKGWPECLDTHQQNEFYMIEVRISGTRGYDWSWSLNPKIYTRLDKAEREADNWKGKTVRVVKVNRVLTFSKQTVQEPVTTWVEE